MTLQSKSGPVVTGGSADRDTAGAMLVVLGFGAVFVAVWPLLAMTLAVGPLDPVALSRMSAECWPGMAC